MNIFRLDKDPFKACEYYQDLHVNKIIIEGSQLIANCYPLERLKEPDCPRTQKGTPRVYGNYNHPLAKWVRESKQNFDWTIKHLQGLIAEKEYRFGPKKHFTESFVLWAKDHPADLPDKGETEYPQCFKTFAECIVLGDPVKGYQNYYNTAKREFQFGKSVKKATWTKRSIPYFWKNMA